MCKDRFPFPWQLSINLRTTGNTRLLERKPVNLDDNWRRFICPRVLGDVSAFGSKVVDKNRLRIELDTRSQLIVEG